jgi:glutamate--cysteine ligase
MDLNPFEPLGIDAQTMRFLDMFLLHALLSPSPPDAPEEIAALARNQHRTAARGREPGLELERGSAQVRLVDWGLELLEAFEPIAQRLDEGLRGSAQEGAHALALAQARHGLAQPQALPSARVLDAVVREHNRSFIAFARAQSAHTRALMLEQPLAPADEQRLQALSQESVREQQRIESLDSLPFEIYRQQYTSPERLGRPVAVAA